MNNLTLILIIAALVLAVRLAGFYRANPDLPAFWQRFFRYTPFGALAGLIMPRLAGPGGLLLPQIIAVAGAVLVVRLTRQLWAGLLVGMALFGLIELILLSF